MDTVVDCRRLKSYADHSRCKWGISSKTLSKVLKHAPEFFSLFERSCRVRWTQFRWAKGTSLHSRGIFIHFSTPWEFRFILNTSISRETLQYYLRSRGIPADFIGFPSHPISTYRTLLKNSLPSWLSYNHACHAVRPIWLCIGLYWLRF